MKWTAWPACSAAAGEASGSLRSCASVAEKSEPICVVTGRMVLAVPSKKTVSVSAPCAVGGLACAVGGLAMLHGESDEEARSGVAMCVISFRPACAQHPRPCAYNVILPS